MSTFFQPTAAALAHANLPLVCVAFALHVIGLIITGERWRLILASMGAPITLVRAVLVNLAGIFVRNVTPTSGLAGDAVRVGLFRSAGVPLTDATVTFLSARLVEIVPVCCLVLIGLPSFGPLTRSPSTANTMVVIVVGMVAIAMLALDGRVRARVATLWRLSAAHPPLSAIVGASLWAAGSWAETAIRLMVVAAAVGVHLSISQGCALAVFSIVGGLVPTLGSLGAIEGSLMAGLLLFGVPMGSATAITIVERVISYGFSTGAGAAALVALGGWDLLRHARRYSSGLGQDLVRARVNASAGVERPREHSR